MDAENRIIEITDMDLRGRGIGRDNEKAVFIPCTVSGDTVAYRTVESKKRYNIGSLCEIISPSDHRRVPACDRFGICGGCAFMHISRELELDIKKRAVEASFRRAGIRLGVDRIISGKEYRYRNKAVFHLDSAKRYGFFTASSNDCVCNTECMLLPDLFNRIIRKAEAVAAHISDPPKSIMLRGDNSGIMLIAQTKSFGETAAVLDTLSDEFPEIVSAYECTGYPTDHNTVFKHHSGKKYIRCEFSQIPLRISPKSFFQINSEIAELLCEEIAASISPYDGALILDLYCGIGTITLGIARHFPSARVIGVEINASAVMDARKNSADAGITNAEFICDDAGRVTFESAPYAIIVDPPRYGLSESMLKTILKLEPKRLVYMSCNPDTLASNSRKLLAGGYSTVKCISADMFPQCAHVETVCVFEKNE